MSYIGTIYPFLAECCTSSRTGRSAESSYMTLMAKCRDESFVPGTSPLGGVNMLEAGTGGRKTLQRAVTFCHAHKLF